jgi:23S rRNA pseudouridine955/2504/2580 synthase
MPRNLGNRSGRGDTLNNLPFSELREKAKALTLYADARMVVVNKPSGLASQAGRGLSEDLASIMQGQARGKDRPVKLIHRLDRETSGVMVMARTSSEAARLSALFAGRDVNKAYLALVAGDASGLAGELNEPLKPLKTARVALVQVARPCDSDAQAASTKISVIKASPAASLVLAQPLTGRMHQIRVHLAHAGHPLLGDHHYGGPLALAGVRVARVMLHAWWLELPDVMDQMQRWTAPVPADMVTLCQALAIPLPMDEATL